MRRWVWAWLLVPMLCAAAPEAELSRTDATGVLGRRVVDASGKEIGRVVDVLVDPSGQPRAVVVDIGGFLGLGNRQVAVAWSTLHVPPLDATDPRVSLDMQDDQVKSAPDYTDPTKPATVVGPAAAEPAPSPPVGEATPATPGPAAPASAAPASATPK